MFSRIFDNLRNWCRSREEQLVQANIDERRNQINHLMSSVLLGSLFSIVAAGLVFSDTRVIKSIGDPLSQAFLWIFIGFAVILIILLLISRQWNYFIHAADWFYQSLVSPALFPIVFLSIILRIFSMYENKLEMAEPVTWIFMAFLLSYFVLLIFFMKHTKPLWALRSKVGTLLLIVFALASVIKISSNLEQFKDSSLIDTLIKSNALYQNDCIFFLIGALIFIVVALILDYLNRQHR